MRLHPSDIPMLWQQPDLQGLAEQQAAFTSTDDNRACGTALWIG
jgi:hypothetical protein